MITTQVTANSLLVIPTVPPPPSMSDLLTNVRTLARVLSVHDGDTVTLMVVLATGVPVQFNCRLNGIDTCEITSRDPEVKRLAVRAKERLQDLIQQCGHVVTMHTHGLDKYGRLLADLFASACEEEGDKGLSFSETLVKEALACVYDGKTKRTEELLLATREQRIV